MSRVAARWRFLAVALAGALIDLGSKGWAFRLLGADPGPPFVAGSTRTIIPRFFDLKATVNPGSLWGLFADHRYLLLFVTLGIFSLLLWIAFSEKGEGIGMQVALGFFCAGAIGNLFDRIRFTHVRDFLDVYVGTWHWPTFNLADTCICLGAGVFFWVEIRRGRESSAAESPEVNAAGGEIP